MTQQLYLLRHAEAEPWNPLGNDFSRPLSSIGNRHSQLLSAWALETLSCPDTVICSPAKRTRETLAPLLAHWPQLLATTDYIDSMYSASLHMLLTLAEDAFTYSERLLMVGHNPGIQALLINLLHPEQAVEIKKMETGNMAVVEFPDKFKRHTRTAKLLHLIRKDAFSFN